VTPANATNKTVTWSIASGTEKASINSTGLITALDNGTSTARATANDGSGVYGTLMITITNQSVPGTGIIFNPNLTYGSVSDIDGNLYKTIQIGTQTWMAENLKYLPSVNPSSSGSQSSARYYVYGYQGTNVSEAKVTANYQTYGVLYNLPAALNGCPTGWHLPTSTELAALTTYLGGESVAGGKLKEINTGHWTAPNTGATNESGYTALPSGVRLIDGTFSALGTDCHYWSSSPVNTSTNWGRDLIYNNANFPPNDFNKDHGLSVRCIKD
jgi:uncharacterized protein (TIGR02145 family)